MVRAIVENIWTSNQAIQVTIKGTTGLFVVISVQIVPNQRAARAVGPGTASSWGPQAQDTLMPSRWSSIDPLQLLPTFLLSHLW